MTDSASEYFKRIEGRVNVALLSQKLVVIFGVGAIGSQVARELANSGVGHLRLIDGDRLETSNLVRHTLQQEHVSMNKAEGVARYLAHIPGLRVDAVPSYVSSTMPDRDLDGLLEGADLIVAATDERDAQRRVGRRALSNDLPAVFPGIHGDNGGEVVVQLDPAHPCFMCWDGFRTPDALLRGATAVNADALAIVELTVHISLGLLDPDSGFQSLLAGNPPGPILRQLFLQRRFAPLDPKFIPRRPDCPSCGVGPPVRQAGGQLEEYTRLRDLCVRFSRAARSASVDVAHLPQSALRRQLSTGARTETVFQELRSWLEGAAGSLQVPAEDDFQSLNGIGGGVVVGLLLGIGGCARYGVTHDPGNPGGYNEGAALGIGFGLLLLCVLIGALIQVVIYSNAARKRAAISELSRTLVEVQTYLAQ